MVLATESIDPGYLAALASVAGIFISGRLRPYREAAPRVQKSVDRVYLDGA
jgi:hypothetical protein